MRILQNMSIQRKQMLIMMLSSTVALLLVCATFIAYRSVAFREELVEKESSVADVISRNVTAAIDFNDRSAAEETLTALRAEPNIIVACIYDRAGQLFAVYRRGSAAKVFVFPAVQSAGHKFTQGQLHLFVPIKQRGEMVGTLFIASDLEALSRQLLRYGEVTALVFLGSLLFTFILSSRLQRLVSNPILHLVQLTRAVAREKDYSLRAIKQGEDELGELIDGFNEMLVQIQERDARLESRVRERTEQLANSVSLLNATLESTAEGIVALDPIGKVININTNFTTMWGIPAQLLEKNDAEELVFFMAGQTLNPRQFCEDFRQQHPQLKNIAAQQVIELKDGRIFECYIRPQQIGELCVGRVVFCRDITERKRVELTLQRERNLFRTVLDNLPSIVFSKDSDGRYLLSNRAHQRVLGSPPEAILGKTTFDIHSPELARQYHEDEMQIVRSGKAGAPKEERILNREMNAERWLLTSRIPLKDENDRIIGIVGISHDITERKEAEAELAYERDLLKTLMENIPDSIYFKDLQSRFVRVSRSKLEKSFAICLERHHAVRVAGGTETLPPHLISLERFAEYLAGRSDFDFFKENEARQIFEQEQEIIRTGKPLIGKLEQGGFQNGSSSWFFSSKMPWRDKNGNIIGTFGISKDVSELKEAEARLEQVHRQLLEASRQAGMSEIASNVLHNVGNVLNSVNVSASMLSQKIKESKISNLEKAGALLREHLHDLPHFLAADPRGKKLPDYLLNLTGHLAREQQLLLDEVDQLAQNIEHIKEIVMMQQTYAKVAGVTEMVAITELVEDSVRINQGAFARHQVQVVREYSEVPPITTEKHKVLQILVNLMRNAKYALDESNASDRRMRLCIQKGSNDSVSVSVIDNGVGISAENMKRIFVHGFTTRANGHGFGLHSSALAAKDLGGTLTAHSDGPGKGARFTLELPLTKDKRGEHKI